MTMWLNKLVECLLIVQLVAGLVSIQSVQCNILTFSARQWDESARSQVERDSSLLQAPPVVPIGPPRYASQLFNGRPMGIHQQRPEVDLFQCVEPTKQAFRNFLETYNRTFEDNIDQIERMGLFMNTLKRTIVLNRIVQDEILNRTNYDIRPSIGNYHFISPVSEGKIALWYADITDCELGLIKYIVFNIIYHLENNDPAEAYRIAKDNSRYLPLMNADGFEQLANILLVRLHDRFKGEEQMSQLFRWPVYLKRLASYAYNRRQAEQPEFDEKLLLISYAYPAYFKDLKYNPLAINRRDDNVRAHEDHEKFNQFHQRRFVNNRERNKRLAIFRQRWTLINQLNGVHRRDGQNVTARPEWHRVRQEPSYHFGQSEKLRADESDQLSASGGADGDQWPRTSHPEGRYKHTQFSDLTDAEFVAYLTNDFSLLDDSKESADYIDNNFPIRYLGEKLKDELALELELRRSLRLGGQASDSTSEVAAPSPHQQQQQQRASFRLARRVIDELINDVGLPIGAVAVGSIPEDEHYSMFTKVSRFFGKTYAQPGERTSTGGSRAGGSFGPSEPELADERQRRYDTFKENYARFKAWFIKEGWTALDESRQVAMLRLADMSWPELKLSLFKICCLTEENLAQLAAANATIQYLGSNQFSCQPLYRDAIREKQPQTSNTAQSAELAALELYYYYTVHFNKHHSDMDTFNKKFAIFRYNIEQIRKHSCTRGLTIYRSLQMKKTDTLSTIDALDSQHNYTDDINLDRYRYFVVPDLNLPPSQQQEQLLDDSNDPDVGFEKLRAGPISNDNTNARLQRVDNETPSRAGITYRRSSFFSRLLDDPDQRANQLAKNNAYSNYAEKLLGLVQNFNPLAQKYRLNSVHRVYELVMQRYSYCMQAVRKIEVNERRQNCQASGPLAEQSNSWLTMRDQLSSSESLQLKQQDQCAFYRMGLEAWDEGLMKQSLSVELITGAKCHAQ